MGATRGTPEYCISHLFLRKRRNEVLEKTLKRTDSLIITVTGETFSDVGHSFKDQRLNWRSHVPGYAAFGDSPDDEINKQYLAVRAFGIAASANFKISHVFNARIQVAGAIVGRPQEHCLSVQRSSRCPSR
jgi:hypothetical protein